MINFKLDTTLIVSFIGIFNVTLTLLIGFYFNYKLERIKIKENSLFLKKADVYQNLFELMRIVAISSSKIEKSNLVQEEASIYNDNFIAMNNFYFENQYWFSKSFHRKYVLIWDSYRKLFEGLNEDALINLGKLSDEDAKNLFLLKDEKKRKELYKDINKFSDKLFKEFRNYFT